LGVGRQVDDFDDDDDDDDDDKEVENITPHVIKYLYLQKYSHFLLCVYKIEPDLT
jgi:hypothetical protein